MESISDIVKIGELPSNGSDILPLLKNEDGTFINQEGTVWDFKKSWPFSYSDSYFHGICRLICAFSNTEGGIIVFGVDDETRRPSSTKIIPNLDRLEQAFEQLTDVTPLLSIRSYIDDSDNKIDILLVKPKRGEHGAPLRFKKTAFNYPANVIYIRHGSQVKTATSNDISTLYLGDQWADDDPVPKGQLPPSPATVREFVGRMDAIDRVFDWLKRRDEPRAFLYGKGGSGKSTIAYQVYKSIKVSGSPFKLGDDFLDRLIFISAKNKYLNVESQKSEEFLGRDFTNEKELYQGILTLGEHPVSYDKFEEISYLKDSVTEFLNDNSCFLVIDDIDTLSTADEETGMDFLMGVLWRAKKSSKLLYTLRNKPTHSLASSLEIPGMVESEFERFVEVCSSQFKVPAPSQNARDTMIMPTSEGRPLIVESIIALRRTAGNYPDAVRLFESEAGVDAREYVFKREWDALDKTDRGREILTILALYGRPIGVEDIVTISRMDASKVRDALASVQEIFLNVQASENETIYSIGDLTKAFVLEMSFRLDLFDRIKARVENFKNAFYPDSPALNTLKNQFYRASATNRNGEARYLDKLLLDLEAETSPKLAEDPRFLCLRAMVRLTRDIRDVSKARIDFETAMDFRHTPDQDAILLWLRAEKSGDSGERMTKEIVDRVARDKGFNSDFKARVKFDRACYLYGRGKNQTVSDPHKAVELLKEALQTHLQAFRIFVRNDSSLISRSEEFSRNTAFTLANHMRRSREADDFIEIINQITFDENVYADPIVEPLQSFMRYPLITREQRRDILQRKAGRFQTLSTKLGKRDIWMNSKRTTEMAIFAKEIRRQYEASLT